jgi:sarcosine oxidase subunit beta
MFVGKYKRLWAKASLKSSYDAVIIGGGLHGLATAYFLARDQGMTDVAVIERRYIGFGGSGRNTAIVRANQRTKENLPLYAEGLKLWPTLTDELDFNLMFFNCGNLNLAHSEAALGSMRLLVASAQFHGIESELLDSTTHIPLRFVKRMQRHAGGSGFGISNWLHRAYGQDLLPSLRKGLMDTPVLRNRMI